MFRNKFLLTFPHLTELRLVFDSFPRFVNKSRQYYCKQYLLMQWVWLPVWSLYKVNSAYCPSGVGKSSRARSPSVGWQVALSDLIWQVTLRSSETGSDEQHLVHPTALLLLTKSGALGTRIRCPALIERVRLLTHWKFETRLRTFHPRCLELFTLTDKTAQSDSYPRGKFGKNQPTFF